MAPSIAYAWTGVKFGYIAVDNSCSLSNEESLVFNVPQPDIYIFSLFANVFIGSSTNVTLEGSPVVIGLSHGSTFTGWWRINGRNIMVNLAKDNQLYVSIIGRTWNDNSWSGFSLSPVMSTVVAFHFARTSQWTNTGRVQFPLQLVRRPSSVSFDGYKFRAPVSGVYFFVMSGGMVAGRGCRISLRHNDVEVIRSESNATTHNGVKVLSGATLILLSVGDSVSVHLDSGVLHSSEKYKELSFMGFLYKPKGQRVALSMHTAHTTTMRNAYVPLSWHINEGLPLRADQPFIIVPVTGLYYVHLTIGILKGDNGEVELHVDGVRWGYARANTFMVNDNGCDTQSVGTVVPLIADSIVSVWIDDIHFLDFTLFLITQNIP